VEYRLRDYQVKPGELDEWLAEWRQKVYPLRLAAGFEVVGAWVAREQNRFVWIIGHRDFAAANDDYYASPERAAMDPDPARHLAQVEEIQVEPIL
jgi:NIPSNAP